MFKKTLFATIIAATAMTATPAAADINIQLNFPDGGSISIGDGDVDVNVGNGQFHCSAGDTIPHVLRKKIRAQLKSYMFNKQVKRTVGPMKGKARAKGAMSVSFHGCNVKIKNKVRFKRNAGPVHWGTMTTRFRVGKISGIGPFAPFKVRYKNIKVQKVKIAGTPQFVDNNIKKKFNIKLPNVKTLTN